MLRKLLPLSIPILLLLALLPSLGWSQETFAFTLTQFLSSGDGVARGCGEPEYGTGLGGRVSVPVLSQWTTLQVAGRAYFLDRGSDCTDGFPPPDGTYLQKDRVNLLARSFVTTDVRLATQLGEAPVSLAVGVGNAWRQGYNLPYVALTAGLTLLDRPDVRLSLEGEYQSLRVSGDLFERTFQNSSVVAEQSLGRVHEWSHGFILGLTLDVPL